MGSQWSKDKAYLKAKQEGYRSRAAIKLKEILKKNPVFNQEDNILDLGAAPGSWLQVMREETCGTLVGIDLNPITPIKGVDFILGDFTDPDIIIRIREKMPVVNGIMCDASPKLSGQRSYDQARAIDLNLKALDIVEALLKPGGNLIMKSFQGEDFSWVYNRVKKRFYSVKTYKAKTSRKGSTEIYILAKNFIGDREDDRIGAIVNGSA
jgi:23S rRNA (uridine2552-2'-O)-methyltransferase